MPDEVFLTGLGEVDPAPRPGRTPLHVVHEAVDEALADAGLGREHVEGLLTGYSLVDRSPMFADVVAEYLGVRPSYCTTLNSGGATGTVLVRQAAAAVAAGLCETVVVAWGDSRGSHAGRGDMVRALSDFAHPEWEAPLRPTIASLYALIASRYLHLHGAGPADLAEVAVAFRQHAALNPLALRREPITVADVLASRPVALPLRSLDCCLVSDYGAAVVVTATPRADGPPPVRLLGSGEAHRHEHITQADDLLDTGSGQAMRNALEQAGLAAQELDLAQLYDSFTITVALQLEELGVVEPGQTGRAFRDGTFGLGGRLPLNTAGGLLSALNGGLSLVVEAVRQLQGRTGRRQVPDARSALVHGIGGVSSAHCALVLGR